MAFEAYAFIVTIVMNLMILVYIHSSRRPMNNCSLYISHL